MSQDTYISHYLGSMVVCSNWWNKRSMCLLYVCCIHTRPGGGRGGRSTIVSLSLSLFSLWECACSITLCMDLIFLLGSLTCQKCNIVSHPFQRSRVYHVPTLYLKIHTCLTLSRLFFYVLYIIHMLYTTLDILFVRHPVISCTNIVHTCLSLPMYSCPQPLVWIPLACWILVLLFLLPLCCTMCMHIPDQSNFSVRSELCWSPPLLNWRCVQILKTIKIKASDDPHEKRLLESCLNPLIDVTIQSIDTIILLHMW